jgi:hypothetical protein
VDHINSLITVDTDSGTYKAEPFYNCPGIASHAFAAGDEVIVRMYQGDATHVIGFTGDNWACFKTPAIVFDDGAYYDGEIIPSPTEELLDRYVQLDRYDCAGGYTFYKNNSAAATDDAFTAIETDWSDGMWHRDTSFYYRDELVYHTYNYETYSHIFNGTRSNVFGRFIHPESGVGCKVYQVNTFYDWAPETSGRVTFDCYLYSSSGVHTRISSAYCDVTGASTQAYGDIVTNVECTASSSEGGEHILTLRADIAQAGLFTSDGSTNILPNADELRKQYAVFITSGDTTENSLFALAADDDQYNAELGIYVKKR